MPMSSKAYARRPLLPRPISTSAATAPFLHLADKRGVPAGGGNKPRKSLRQPATHPATRTDPPPAADAAAWCPQRAERGDGGRARGDGGRARGATADVPGGRRQTCPGGDGRPAPGGDGRPAPGGDGRRAPGGDG